MPCFIVLYFIAVCRCYCLFDRLKVCGSTLCWSVAAISQQHLLSMSLSQFGNFCNIPNFLIIIIIFFLVTPKQIVVIWWHHKLCPYKMADLVNKCVFWLPCQAAILRLSLSSGLLVPCLRQNNLGMRPVDNPTVASKHASERKSLTSLTFSQKLEMIRLSEEGISETELEQKPGLLCQLFKVWTQRKSSWRKLKVLL